MYLFSKRLILASTLFIQLLAFSIFLLGFFPLKQSLQDSGEKRNHTLKNHVISHPVKQFEKVVIVLVDALRSDFVYERPEMEFVRKQLKIGHGSGYTVKAHPPTVTLPRIKALTSGTIPGFVDIVLNFDSKSLNEDNLISQSLRAGRKIVFYGDDTWMKLFPHHFIRSEGTTSFFVKDYTEVDDNVTRHIDSELSANDWDLMVLHYLGLDHIGHTVGPSSPLVRPKLQEMDSVVQKIYTALEDKEDKFLILVCGDHGMSDQGGHGGASNREILVPAVFLSPSYRLQGKHQRSRRESLQIDLAPTLSLLMGLPIPNNNLGQVLVDALYGYHDYQILDALYINMQQIVRLIESNIADFQKDSSYDLYQYALELHNSYLDDKLNQSGSEISRVLRSYESAIEAMSSKVSGSLTKYDMYAMILAVLLLALTLGVVLLMAVFDVQTVNVSTSPPIVIAGTLLAVFCHMTLCTSQSFHSNTLCGRSFMPVAIQLCISVSIGLLVTLILSFPYSKRKRKWFPGSAYTRLLWVGTVLHIFSFGSSSFVEEEHQTWYFLVMTFNLVAVVTEVKGHLSLHCLNKPKNRRIPSSRSKLYDELIKKDFNTNESSEQSRAENKVGSHDTHCRQLFNSQQNNAHQFHKISHSSKENGNYQKLYVLHWRQLLPWKQISGIMGVMLLGRLMRAINQTGNKWLDNPDLADWLMIPDNKPSLSVVVFVSHLVIILACQLKLGVESLMFVVGIYTCYQYRVTTGAVNSFFDLYSTSDAMSKGMIEARVVFLTVILMNLISVIKWCSLNKGRKSMQTEQEKNLPLKCVRTLQLSWILLMTLLLRTHNTMLVAMVIIQELLLWRCVVNKISLPSIFLAILCWWMGQTVFFQQGNSNSISTVDVSAGYVGLDDYQPVLVTVLLYCSTYAGPIYWLITLVKYIIHIQHDEECMKKKTENYTETNKATTQSVRTDLLDGIHVLSMERLSSLLLYTIIVTSQRYHLFVWTVFSPKLLYEGMLTITMSIFSFIILAVV